MSKKTKPNKDAENLFDESVWGEMYDDKQFAQSIVDYLEKEYPDERFDNKNFDELVRILMVKSDGDVNKYGIPTATDWDKSEESLNDEEFHQKLNDLIENELGGGVELDDGQKVELTGDQMEWLKGFISGKIGDIGGLLGQRIGEIFQKKIRDSKELYEKSLLKSDVQYHYDTLEECSADYYNKKNNGEYTTYRNAWKDAVKKGITYTHKKSGNKIKLQDWKQLERALERIRDLGKEEDYGIEPKY